MQAGAVAGLYTNHLTTLSVGLMHSADFGPLRIWDGVRDKLFVDAATLLQSCWQLELVV